MTQDNNMKGVENYLPRNVHIFKYNFRNIDQKNILRQCLTVYNHDVLLCEINNVSEVTVF